MENNYNLSTLLTPFKADEIEWRVGSINGDKSKGMALAYVTNRAIQNRLDLVFGVMNWQNQFKEWKKDSQICGISVWDSVKLQWITKWDGADDSATEAIKGGLSDSMKRAAYQWGIGRYLYEMPQIWVKIVAAGKSYRMETPPKIPKEFLPEGFKYPDNFEQQNTDAAVDVNDIQDNHQNQKEGEKLSPKLLQFLSKNKITSQQNYFNYHKIDPKKEETIPPFELWEENLIAFKKDALISAILNIIKDNLEKQKEFGAMDKTLANLTDYYTKITKK